ncbi:MAG: hypothetical protein ACTSP5_14020, partial [Candidatus Heimdallarchaeota archaeon]
TMKLNFPLDPESIREGIQEIVDDVLEETKWELKRTPTKTKIKIGTAPEYNEFFGVTRGKGKIEFGKWINDLTPDYVSEGMLEFLIIREAIALFLTDDVLFGELSSLTNIMLNIASMSYFQELHKTKTINIKLSLYKTRLFKEKDAASNNTESINEIVPLIDSVLKQNVSYLLIINSYLYFIEDIEEIDTDEIIQSIKRYVAKTSEEIVFPIHLKENLKKILYHLSDLGYDSTLNDIATLVNVDESIISKELKKLDSRYRAKWNIERNWYKFGLHIYLVIIRFDKSLKNNQEKMLNYIQKNHYVFEIFTGANDEFSYVYSLFFTSHFISERLASQLEKFQKDGSISTFDLKRITERTYSTAILNEPHVPSLDAFKKLLSGKIAFENIQLWSTSNLKDKTPIDFDSKDYALIKFLGYTKTKSITSYDVYGIHIPGFTEYLKENDFDPNNMTDSLNFFKNNENQAKKRKLLDYRLGITLTDVTLEDSLLVRIELNPDEKDAVEILAKLGIFSSRIVLKSYNDFFIIIVGLKFDHYITDLIKELLIEKEVAFEIFSIKNAFIRNVAYQDLYDYTSKKWALIPFNYDPKEMR